AFETCRLDRHQLLEHGARVADGGIHDRLLDLPLLLGVHGAPPSHGQSSRYEGSAAKLHEVASIQDVCHGLTLIVEGFTSRRYRGQSLFYTLPVGSATRYSR